MAQLMFLLKAIGAACLIGLFCGLALGVYVAYYTIEYLNE